MNTVNANPSHVEIVVYQHADEAAFLWSQRSHFIAAPHITLRQLARHDDRIAAHIDGLRIADEAGRKICQAQLITEDPGAMFTAMVMAAENRDEKRIAELFALAESIPAMQRGLTAAFGWVSSQFLQGTVKELLTSRSPFRCHVGLASCVMHQVALGQAHDAVLRSADGMLRARALRAIGELGQRDLMTRCEQHLNEADIACRFGAAWSGVLLGDRAAALDVLKSMALIDGPFKDHALQLTLKAVSINEGHRILKALAADPKNKRTLVKGAGIVGDPFYLPWLIKQMEIPELARLAGESFSLVTGLDLSYLGLDRKNAGDVTSGPNDDPNDTDVSMDEDENLPWPHQDNIQAWWNANQHRFQNGTRYFMGEPINAECCKKTLRRGFQRQRIAAALHLSLLAPGTPLFATSAPAWRQQRWLAKMG